MSEPTAAEHAEGYIGLSITIVQEDIADAGTPVGTQVNANAHLGTMPGTQANANNPPEAWQVWHHIQNNNIDDPFGAHLGLFPTNRELNTRIEALKDELDATNMLVREMAAARESDRKKMNQMAKILKPIYWGPDGPGGQLAIANLKKSVKLDDKMVPSPTPEMMQDAILEKLSGVQAMLKNVMARNEENKVQLGRITRLDTPTRRAPEDADADAPPAKRTKLNDDADAPIV